MFKKVHTMIKESFASYVGFYLGEKYYTSHGFVKPSVSYNITEQGRQTWDKTKNQYCAENKMPQMHVKMYFAACLFLRDFWLCENETLKP